MVVEDARQSRKVHLVLSREMSLVVLRWTTAAAVAATGGCRFLLLDISQEELFHVFIRYRVHSRIVILEPSIPNCQLATR